MKTLAGEFALAADDIATAQLLAASLVTANHIPAWSLAAGAGSHKRLGDDAVRVRLLSYALLHCPAERMALLLEELQAADRRSMNAGGLCLESLKGSRGQDDVHVRAYTACRMGHIYS